MKKNDLLNQITDSFLMTLGTNTLRDIDTPSFMRRKYGVGLPDNHRTSSSGKIVEPDEKIVNFLSVIKRRDNYIPNAVA